MSDTDTTEAQRIYPPGEYAIVELLGHTTLVGRIAEIERFGTKMLAIEPLFRGELLPAVFQGGASIYRLTPCSAETAFAKGPQRDYQLPVAIRAIVPELLLAAPEGSSVHEYPGAHDDELRDEPF